MSIEEMRIREEVRALWRTCFSDSEAFVSLYFSRRYRPEINRCLQREGRVVSALQAIPYPTTCFGTTVKMNYISGACTAPEWRGRGLMRLLLDEVHRQMSREGVALSTLIPADRGLCDYYARSGYAEVFCGTTQTVTLTDVTIDRRIRVSVCEKPESVFPWVERKMKERPFAVQHPSDDLEVVTADWQLGGGLLLQAHLEGMLVGVAFCVLQNNEVVVAEALFDSRSVRDALLREALVLYRAEKLVYMLPSEHHERSLGMARVVDVPQMLALYARTHPQERLCLEVVDEEIPENNGVYRLEGGLCRTTDAGTSFVSGEEVLPERFSITELTTFLFREEGLYLSLMMN